MNAVTRQRPARVLGPDVTHRLKESPTVMTPDPRPFPLRARRQDGFTLIELLVVIVILGVLAAIVVFSVRGIGDKGHDTAVAADAATLRTAEESFCAKHGHYGTIADLKSDGFLAGDPGYNMVAVGEENKCGRGAKSSYTMYETSPTQRTGAPIPVAAGPNDVAVDEKTNRVYVVSSAANGTVTVIDGKTDKQIGTPIDVSGAAPTPTRIAVNSATGQVYVGGTGGVAIIDTANGDRVTRVDFPTTVSGLAVSPENGDVYVGGGPVTSSQVSYIAAGSSTATPIPLPAAGITSAGSGMDFSFNPERHEVYFAKQGTTTNLSPNIGLFSISTQTHTVRLAAELPSKSGCSSTSGYGHFMSSSARGVTAVDPHRGLVYLLASKCVLLDPEAKITRSVGTVVVINPADGTFTAIDEVPGTNMGHQSAVYSAASASVYVFSSAGPAGRITQIEGKTATGQVPTIGISLASSSNLAHKLTMLKNSNRLFVAQLHSVSSDLNLAPGGLGVVDGTTLLPQAPLATPAQFGSLAVNNTTAKVYALDPDKARVVVFGAGSV
ncbi:prepilin-type N-terminal cleavage/methylation domain-containing protein [Streptomyces sp. NPDC002812]|uniref:prepilin-type N-terminal cleavage/methylation domain-containing protein n=1 Tax=Streptomyces sp. NPDC002812 TaxID=3154434 RepID=UPI00332BF285